MSGSRTYALAVSQVGGLHFGIEASCVDGILEAGTAQGVIEDIAVRFALPSQGAGAPVLRLTSRRGKLLARLGPRLSFEDVVQERLFAVPKLLAGGGIGALLLGMGVIDANMVLIIDVDKLAAASAAT